MTVSIDYVGFDIIYRCSVHQVSSFHMNHRSPICFPFYPVYTHRRQADMIGSERTPGSKHPNLLISTQYRGSYNGTICFMFIGRKFPNQPKIVKPLYPTECIGITEFGFKNNLTLQFFYQTSLFGNTELTGKGERKCAIGFISMMISNSLNQRAPISTSIPLSITRLHLIIYIGQKGGHT